MELKNTEKYWVVCKKKYHLLLPNAETEDELMTSSQTLVQVKGESFLCGLCPSTRPICAFSTMEFIVLTMTNDQFYDIILILPKTQPKYLTVFPKYTES